MIKETFLIDVEDFERANNLANYLKGIDINEKIIAKSLAVLIAEKYLRKYEDTQLEIDIDSSLYNLPLISSKLDNITDIYINNNFVNIKLYFENEDIVFNLEELKESLLPTAFMFIKLNNDLSNGTITGFLLPESINANEEDEFVNISEDSLVNFEEIIPFLEIKENFELSNEYKLQIINLLDNEDTDDNFVYELLLNSKNAREYLRVAAKTQHISNYISLPIIEDNETIEDTEFSEEKEKSEFVEFLPDNDSDENEVYENIIEETSEEFTNDITENSVADIISEEVILENNDYASDEVSGNKEIINDLFEKDYESENPEIITEDTEHIDGTDDNLAPAKQNNKKLLPIISILTFAVALGYYGYTNYANNTDVKPVETPKVTKEATQKKAITPKQEQQEAMPNETIENIDKILPTEEATSVSIPAIEKSLDASIMITNLSVSWEVPSSYLSNTTAKKYLVKLGKILQLNLKTELLLLNKPPITNKIAVELTFNKNKQLFEVKGITISSGEKNIDDLILHTIKTCLNDSLRLDLTSLGNLDGNPILVIRL